jgi:hypothetical protein
MAETNYAFIKGSDVVNIAVFDNPSDELISTFKQEFLVDDIIPTTESAVIGGTWDGTKFWLPKPFPSWVKNEDTNEWDAPVAKPTDSKLYVWDEPTLSWKEPTPPTV